MGIQLGSHELVPSFSKNIGKSYGLFEHTENSEKKRGMDKRV